MKAIKLTALSAAALLSTSAMANVVTDTAGSVVDGGKTIFKTLVHSAAVSLELGSLGYGANVAWSVNDTTELQAGWAGGDITDLVGIDDIKVGDTKYLVDTDFSNPYLGVQMRPAANWFTVGAGVIVPNNEIKARAASGTTVKVLGQNYDLTNNVEAKIENGNTLAPYLTVGFRPNLNSRWGVFGEVGAAYMGKPDVTVTGLDDVTSTRAGVAAGTTVGDDLKQEIEDKATLEWFPIAKVGVTYRF
ncbi:MAG: hypothetical protein Q4G13_06290 [Moraxella sp.]|nr:hypothetical protein [Moraxella sp.]